MATNPSHCAFKVRIDYFSGAEAFATLTVRLDVHDSSKVQAAASRVAEASTYHNERVPDLSYTVTIVPLDPDDTDPSPAGARVKPVCADCGSDQLVRDAAARWDMNVQDWTRLCKNASARNDRSVVLALSGPLAFGLVRFGLPG